MLRTVWLTVAIVAALLAAPGNAAAATRTWIGGDGLPRK